MTVPISRRCFSDKCEIIESLSRDGKFHEFWRTSRKINVRKNPKVGKFRCNGVIENLVLFSFLSLSFDSYLSFIISKKAVYQRKLNMLLWAKSKAISLLKWKLLFIRLEKGNFIRFLNPTNSERRIARSVAFTILDMLLLFPCSNFCEFFYFTVSHEMSFILSCKIGMGRSSISSFETGCSYCL